MDKLRLARDMLRHALPSGDDEALLDRALTALLMDLARKKFGARREKESDARISRRSASKTASPGTPTSSREALLTSDGSEESESRSIPAAVKRVVWVRDLGRCTFVGTDGHRCKERGFLEFHHVRPHAVGGEPTADNIQLRCGPTTATRRVGTSRASRSVNGREAKEVTSGLTTDEGTRSVWCHLFRRRSFPDDRP